MKALSKVLLERLRSVTLDLTDQRYVSEQEVRLYVWFHEMLFDEIINLGGAERGYVFRQRGETCLLVYKATFDGIPQVVFVTGGNPVDCIRILFRQFYGETLKWVKDKYP